MKTTLCNAVAGDSLSALADGELRGAAFVQALNACENDPTLLASWSDYHLIGDVLRSPDLLVARRAAPFLTRLQSQLAQETIQPVVQTDDLPTPPITPPAATQVAANDFIFRWKMLAGMTSMGAVAVMLWAVVVPTASINFQLVQNQLPTEDVLVASPQGTIVRDARLEELLAAHKQVGGNSALQMPSGFLRNATFETLQHARR